MRVSAHALPDHRDTRLAGTEIAEGDLVTLDIAAANRDPEVYADPSAFDPERSGQPPLTFGSEPRLCPGKDHALALAAGILDTRDPARALSAAGGGCGRSGCFPSSPDLWRSGTGARRSAPGGR